LANLNHLQSGLLENGFKLLKPGGILVYSTCSFDYHQNEEIIEKLLNQENEAELMDATIGFKCSVGWREGKIKGTLRFSPSISSCGGMFIAKIRRKKVYE
jgi:16S rRNA C967 or C1407 C5-methylase (RsmB/RsmF family)